MYVLYEFLHKHILLLCLCKNGSSGGKCRHYEVGEASRSFPSKLFGGHFVPTERRQPKEFGKFPDTTVMP